MSSSQQFHLNLTDTETLPYMLRRSRRARHVLLHVDAEGGVEVVVPWRASLKIAHAFVRHKRAWLVRVLKRQQQVRSPVRRRLVTGETVPLLHETLALQVHLSPDRKRSQVRRKGQNLTIAAASTTSARTALERWYRREALHYFTRTTRDIAHALGVTVGKISIGNPKTQWGSASAQGRLSFSWRLMLATPDIAYSVAVHEVVHLLHRNHSPRFWAAVERLNPLYRFHRRWLRQSGNSLRI